MGILQLYFRFETSTLRAEVYKNLEILNIKLLHRQLDIERLEAKCRKSVYKGRLAAVILSCL